MEDLRFRGHQPTRHDAGINALASPFSNGSAPSFPQPGQASEARNALSRRFTADPIRLSTHGSTPTSFHVPSGSSQASARLQQEYQISQVQLIEKKKQDYERIREQRRRFELQMQQLDQQQRREAQELARMEEEMSRLTGHQSEPTTPPEYLNSNANQGSAFSSLFPHSNRYSTPTLTSPPPGLLNRPGRSGSVLTSPQNGPASQRYGFDDYQVPSRSVPTTRRNSDDDPVEPFRLNTTIAHRPIDARTNRYSMPATRPRAGLYDSSLDQTNTTRFLFGDDEPSLMLRGSALDESFPTLVRRGNHVLSASSVALDLAFSPPTNPDPRSSNSLRHNATRHRAQQSMSAINAVVGSPGGGDSLGSSVCPPASFRHSLDLHFSLDASNEASSNTSSGPSPGPPRLTSSYSANDIPTIRSAVGSPAMNSNANNHAQQHFHNHNASMGRIPAGAMPNRQHHRELSNDGSVSANREQTNAFSSMNSALQNAGGPVYGQGTSAVATGTNTPGQVAASSSNPSINSFTGGFYPLNSYPPAPPAPAIANAPPSGPGPMPVSPHPGSGAVFHGANMIVAGMQQMSINGANSGGGGTGGTIGHPFPHQQYPHQGHGGEMPYDQANKPHDSQARVIQHRRQQDSDAMSDYQGAPLAKFHGRLHELCKDQHGCRFLQKKLEERDSVQVHQIWLETNKHVIELMTDPFGNYLCQKLLEFCNDDERTVLIQNASQDMVRIALNQHGTRALQKMIEHVSTPQQVHLIIQALRLQVVRLIQDLNGNHVIQKCLNKLTAADAQFIFDAVGENCIEVGTHRHGCCVLQRCIDHASGEQKVWLIQKITENASILVKDAFGNYVLQYIIDLNEPSFTEPMVVKFRGEISALSRHKFSSNVIEKALRCALPLSKDMILEEISVPDEFKRLIKDGYGNYVVQTALEVANPQQKYRLVELLRPCLILISDKPYHRRFGAKIAAYDSRGTATTSGQSTPSDNTQGQIPLRPDNSRVALGGPSSSLAASGSQSNVGMSGLPIQAMRHRGSVYQIGPPSTGMQALVQQGPYNSMMAGNFPPQGHSDNPNSMRPSEARWV